jgi:Uma2 family endonuclease
LKIGPAKATLQRALQMMSVNERESQAFRFARAGECYTALINLKGESDMTTSLRWTSSDLEALPYKEGTRYEIIDGELYVSRSPHYHHQYVCSEITRQLANWSKQTGGGRVIPGPGVIFSEDNDVIPDVVWLSSERLATALGADGHFHEAPELIIEVLSRGVASEGRDRVMKLQLYSRHGVNEYWIIDWRLRSVEVYRRQDAALDLIATLWETDTLETPLLPGFSTLVDTLFDTVST